MAQLCLPFIVVTPYPAATHHPQCFMMVGKGGSAAPRRLGFGASRRDSRQRTLLWIGCAAVNTALRQSALVSFMLFTCRPRSSSIWWQMRPITPSPESSRPMNWRKAGSSSTRPRSGSPMSGFTVDAEGNRRSCDSLQHEDGILYADLDMEDTIEGKQYHDVVSAYQRFDVFNLTVDTTRKMPCNF